MKIISARVWRRRRRPQKDFDFYAEGHHGAIVRPYSEIIGKWKWLMWNGLENLLLDNGIYGPAGVRLVTVNQKHYPEKGRGGVTVISQGSGGVRWAVAQRSQIGYTDCWRRA